MFPMGPQEIAHAAVTKWHANQDETELAGLLELVEPGWCVVEIGCDRGGSLWAYRTAGAGRVIGVDLPAGGWGTGLACDPHGATMVVGDSHHPGTHSHLQAVLNGRQIDMLFIDGDHTLDGVRQDYDWYAPLVRTGGIIALHDICRHRDYPALQVDELWRDICRTNPGRTSEIINRDRPWDTGMGIGVLRCV